MFNFNFDALCKNDVVYSDKYTFVWRISEFSSRIEETGKFFQSKYFSIKGPGNETSEWFIKMYPNGNSSKHSDYVSIFLNNNSTTNVFSKCEVSILDSNNDKKKVNGFAMKLMKPEQDWGWPQFFHRTSQMTEYVPNDILTLVFDVTIRGDIKESIELFDSSHNFNVLSTNYHQGQLSLDLGHLLNDKEYTDVTIECWDKKFDCHKNILASRSPVFKTMFESNMKEKVCGSVEIKNMSLEVFESLLEYIYTGDSPNIDTLASELFSAADLYQIVTLKELCEVKLILSIDIDDCIEFLILGDLHQASSLKASALKFVSQNMDKIDPDEWKNTLIAFPTLLIEMETEII